MNMVGDEPREPKFATEVGAMLETGAPREHDVVCGELGKAWTPPFLDRSDKESTIVVLQL